MMDVPARVLEREKPVEERIARLETKVDHIQSDMADMKLDIRSLQEKIDKTGESLTQKIDAMDQKLSQKIDAVDQKLAARIDGVVARIDAVDQKLTARIDGVVARIDAVKDSVTDLALSVEQSFRAMERSIGSLQVGRALDRVCWLLMSGALLGIMARAFKWL